MLFLGVEMSTSGAQPISRTVASAHSARSATAAPVAVGPRPPAPGDSPGPRQQRRATDSGKTLAQQDPENADLYRANAAEARARLEQTETEIEAQLAPIRDHGFIVFHDAYGYFTSHFALSPLGPDIPWALRSLGFLQKENELNGASQNAKKSQHETTLKKSPGTAPKTP